MVTAESNVAPRTYGNWRRPITAGLFGLGSLGTTLLILAMILLVITVMIGGLIAAGGLALVLGGVFLAVTTRDGDNRNVLDRVSARVSWWRRRSAGEHIYRSGPLGRTPWGTFQLPGLAASTELSEFQDSYGRPVALVHSPAAATYSVVIATDPDGASLVDQEQVDSWVADWGQWLRNLRDQPGIESASVTIETAPDSGWRLRREVEQQLDDDAPPFAREVMQQVVADYPQGSSTVKAYVTLTFHAARRAGGRRRTADEVARELAARLPYLTGGLQATGAGAARALSARQLCRVIRVAYDPASARTFDEADRTGEPVELGWHEVGPVATDTSWDGYVHDSAFSTSWEMTQPPHGQVQSSVLTSLLAPHADVSRKRVTLLYRPLSGAESGGLVESDKRAAEFRVSSTDKPSARDLTSLRAANATAEEEASGAGLVMFGMLVTATVIDRAAEEDARAAIDDIGNAAQIRLRPSYGMQDTAFAAGLPLGLSLRQHFTVASEIREKL